MFCQKFIKANWEQDPRSIYKEEIERMNQQNYFNQGKLYMMYPEIVS